MIKTKENLRDVQQTSGADVQLNGASIGFNSDSQYNVFQRDGDLVFFRNINGIIEIVIQNGNSGTLETVSESYSGIIEFGSGDKAIEIFIRQVN